MRNKIITIQIVAFLLLPMLAFGQQGILQYSEKSTANLTKSQSELLEVTKTKPQIVNVYLVKIPNISEIETIE